MKSLSKGDVQFMKSQQLDIYQLWQSWQDKQDLHAYEQLVDVYIGLVDQVVIKMKRTLSNQITYEELKSHGFMGLLDALKKFDYQRGIQFETYASLRIRGAILDGIRENDWVPRSIRDKTKRIEKAYQELEQQNLRTASDKEVMDFLKIDEEEFKQTLKESAWMNTLYLDEPLDESGQSKGANLAEQVDLIDQKLDQNFLKEVLVKAINKLPEKEKIVVSLYYYEELNLTEIAEVLKLSTSRISQLHTKAIFRLRGALGRQKKQLI